MSTDAPWRGIVGSIATGWRALRARLEDWDGAGAPDALDKGRLRRWLPGAIVLVSLGAASMGWQASVADERATQKDDLSRQELVLQQQIRLRKVQQVDSDLRLFDQIDRDELMAVALEAMPHRSHGRDPRLLLAKGAREAARQLAEGFDYPDAIRSTGNDPYYDVEAALEEATSSDRDLSGLAPARLRQAAVAQRIRGLHLVGLAVLFVVALVLFTCAAITSGRGHPRRRYAPRIALTRRASASGAEASAYLFTACGVVVTVAAAVMFVLVRWL
jgi:hypothetical protein